MTREPLQNPSAPSWRDIPQPVVPRAMSAGGRRRFVLGCARVVALAAVFALIGWGGTLVLAAMRENTKALPDVARTPLKRLQLSTNGVLDQNWLAGTLALPRNATLIDLNLEKLRARLLQEDQVINATLTRHFPDLLVVQITERYPVVRLPYDDGHVLLVARDGVVYNGYGYDEKTVATLPWLEGVTLVPNGGHFRPIAGMPKVADLLAKARLEAERLFLNWESVSLAKLDSDHRIDVRAKEGAYVANFNTKDDFFLQLVRLSYVYDRIPADAAGRYAIDLTLGADVPVTPLPATEASPTTFAASIPANRAQAGTNFPAPESKTPATLHSENALFLLPQSHPTKTKREL